MQLERNQLKVRTTDLIQPYEQRIDGTCGEAALLMYYRALGERVDEDILIAQIVPSMNLDSKYTGGTLHNQMHENALLHGYKSAYGYDLPYEYLVTTTKNEGMPVIVEWMTDFGFEVESDCHYSVVTDADENRVKLADPSSGEWRYITRNNWERKWLGFERDGSITRRFGMIIF